MWLKKKQKNIYPSSNLNSVKVISRQLILHWNTHKKSNLHWSETIIDKSKLFKLQGYTFWFCQNRLQIYEYHLSSCPQMAAEI